MKILFSHYLLDDDNPPVRTNQAISHELRQLGHEVLLHRSFGPPRTFPGASGGSGGGRADLVSYLKSRVWFARAVARNRGMLRNDQNILRSYRPDVILVRHDPYCDSMARAAAESGLPLVTYVDAPMAYETRLYHGKTRWHPPGLVEAIERRALRPSRALTATSHPTAQKVREDYQVTVPIHIIANGLHPDRFPECSPADRQQRRADLGITAPHVLGFQGTFKAFHGIDRLRDLMYALANRQDVHWLLIGDGPERAALEKEVAGRVPATFMGRQPAERMGEWMSLMDVAVVPHHYVPGIFYLSPLKVIESAAAGCAVVASDQGDIPWLLDEGRAGVVVSDPDLGAWTAAIESLLDDPARRQALGQAARRYVLDRFTWRHIAEQYATVLQGVVGTAGTNAQASPAAVSASAMGTDS